MRLLQRGARHAASRSTRASRSNVASAIHALALELRRRSRRSIATTSPTAARRISRDTIRETRARIPQCRIEVLIPDFQGDEAALRTVLDARPDVLNHNIETVPRLYRMARPGGRYDRALELLDRSRALRARASRPRPA